MIRDEEQRAWELEQEIALMQSEGQHDLQHGPPLQQRAPAGDLFIPQRGPFILHATAFQGIDYLDERSPLAPQLQVSPWPANFRAGTYPKYNSSTDPAQYIMSYQVAVASSGGDDATMAKSFIIALEGPALTWYTRLPPLSIDSWKGLRDKFVLNFQGYRPDTDALAELSLCKQKRRKPYGSTSAPHVDAMVINCSVADWDLHKVLVDNGSQADIIFLHAFDRMGISHS
jgi:hypothetical protein